MHCCSCPRKALPNGALSMCDNPACASGATEATILCQEDDFDVSVSTTNSTPQPSPSPLPISDLAQSHYRLVDDLMQEELNSLRRAVAEMQCDHHEVEHARRLANAMLQVSHVEGEALYHTQAERMQRQDVALEDAQFKITSLERGLVQLQAEKSRLEATCASLCLELKQLKEQQTQYGEAESAEVEILRRRLVVFEKQAKKAQVDLLASQKLQEGGPLLTVVFPLLVLNLLTCDAVHQCRRAASALACKREGTPSS